MSQIYVPTTSSTPSIPTNFTVDYALDAGVYTPPGSLTPVANNLFINGLTTDFDNPNGIQTVADPNNSQFMLVELTNRFSQTEIAPDNSTTILLAFPLDPVSGGYRFYFDVIAIDTFNDDVCGYTIQATFKTLGGVASVVQTPYIDADEDIMLNAINMNASLSNEAILSFTNSTNNDWAVKFVGHYIKI